ncbi:hypothetical protein ACFOEK_01790 [Litoribrevibacter euphylliae]|uniref:Bacterial virulence factor lipase N-terminal domain-containing protein n=1 Tax=Litoribrevibacter euphylliae TaxID=1834034 RepID=A0ABV7HDC3_9GAMM
MVKQPKNNLSQVFTALRQKRVNSKQNTKLKLFAALGLPMVALFGCSDDSSSSGGSDGVVEETFVPYEVSALPMPNDGYGYDYDGTISLPSERTIDQPSAEEFEKYYQSYETSVGALDGWGMSNVIKVPIANRNTEERYPLDQNSLKNNVMLIKEDGTNQANEPVEIEVISTGSEIEIKPLAALDDESVYFIAVSDRVLTQDGLPLEADSNFTRIRVADANELPEKEQAIQQQILAAENAFNTAGGVGSLVYATQFTTQSVHPILQAMRNNISESTVQMVGASYGELQNLSDSKTKYDTYSTTLKLPSYVPFVDSLDGEDDNGVKESCNIDPYDPIPNCPDLYKWMQSSDGEHLTKDNPMPAEVASIEVPVLIYSPANWAGEPLPVAMFVHGITGKKENASTMAKDFAKKGYLVVAIDQIYHGERALKAENKDAEGNDIIISAATDSSYFVNITSPLTLRSNLHQAIIDQLSLRYALENTEWANTSDYGVHLIGQSLGGIMSVMVGEQSQDFGEGNEGFAFETVNYVVPGQGLTGIMLESNHLGEETKHKIKKSPDVQRGIAESVIPEQCTTESTNEECITALNEFVEVEQNAELVAMLEDEIYSLILPGLIQGVQTTIDSGDPANHTQQQRENQQLTSLIQAKGTCGDDGCQVGEYMPDFVIPNSSPNNPLVGTEPLIKALGLTKIVPETQTDNENIAAPAGEPGIRGYINATVGGHGTYLFPYEGPMDENGAPSIPTGDTMDHVWSATDTQQSAVAEMVDSHGQNVIIKDPTTVEGGE